jgi:hypothetical protein
MSYRYWVRLDQNTGEVIEYSLTDGEYLSGYIETTKRPDDYPDMYTWSVSQNAWVFILEKVKLAIATRRYQAETQPITVGGHLFQTGDRDKTLLNGAVLKCLRNPAYSFNWKTLDGSFVTMNETNIIALHDAVIEYTEGCFEREYYLLQELDNGTFTASVLDIGWPNTLIS